MYGAILGDIIGSPFEFDRGDKTKNFDLFSEGCGFTDDSVMTIAVGEVLYALAHSSLRPEFSIEYTVADVEKCKNELLHKAIEDSIQKAQVLTTAANVKLGEIQAIDYSWGEIDFVTKPLNEMRLMECTECEMSAPGAYDIDIEADDINVIDTATVIWEIA